MGRSPGACSAGARAAVINKGPWTEAEDEILSAHVKAHGEGNWRLVPKLAGLSRCGKSCRLRWINYLRPNLKRGNFSVDEDNLILTLHALLGNRWSLIAGRIPGRTDNEIKNYWNTHLRRKLRSMGIDPTSYKVGLTLTSITNQEPDLHANAFDVPSSSSPPQIQATTTTTTTTTIMENSHLVSSSGDSTSTSTSYDSASATSNSEPDSSSPTGVSILAEQLLEPWMHLQVPISLNSQPLGSNSGFGWSHEQMQLLDPLDLSGVLQPLESLLVHNEVPWTSSFFDSLVE